MSLREKFIYIFATVENGTEILLTKLALSVGAVDQARQEVVKAVRRIPVMTDFRIMKTCTSCWGKGYTVLRDDTKENPCHWCGGSKMESMVV